MPATPHDAEWFRPICVREGWLFALHVNYEGIITLYAIKIEGGEVWEYITRVIWEGQADCHTSLDVEFATSDVDPRKIMLLYIGGGYDPLVCFRNLTNGGLHSDLRVEYPRDCALIPGSGGIACLVVSMGHDERFPRRMLALERLGLNVGFAIERVCILVIDPQYDNILYRSDREYSTNSVRSLVATRDWQLFLVLADNADESQAPGVVSGYDHHYLRSISDGEFGDCLDVEGLEHRCGGVLPDRIPDCLWSHTRVAFPTRIGQDEECYLRRIFNCAAADTVNRTLLGVMWDCEVVSLLMDDLEEDPIELVHLRRMGSACISENGIICYTVNGDENVYCMNLREGTYKSRIETVMPTMPCGVRCFRLVCIRGGWLFGICNANKGGIFTLLKSKAEKLGNISLRWNGEVKSIDSQSKI
ncbi:hypothetical protein FOL47_002766 [Perkinsus chesapeaki]|uniref:Uncharacterized protein n=1 Tax=Perkinsus chesapeaki TaxID=330153 RepID=A0A7J6N026_PERCH|nr:hypothetical protein FOL47_002766 [Perkinsus chesapeaki]